MKSPWIRRLALASAALLALLVITAGLLIATFDARRYQSLAVDWMQSQHQRALAIDGPVEISFFPRLAVKLSRVRLSERGRADEFAAIDEAALSVRLLPLLRKELVVERVGAKGVRLHVTRDAHGHSNFDDFITKPAAPGAPGGPAESAGGASGAGAGALHFDVSAVTLEDLRVTLNDEANDLAGDLLLHSFASGRLADGLESPVALKAQLRLTRPQIVELALDGTTTLALDVARGAVALSHARLDLRGQAAGISGLALALDGGLSWDGQAVRAQALRLFVKSATRGSGASATTLADSSVEFGHAAFDAAGKRLQLDALKLALNGRLGPDAFALSLQWPQLAVDAQSLQGSALSGHVKLDGARSMSGDFRSGPPTGNFDALRLPGLDIQLSGSIGTMTIDAHVGSDLLLDAGHATARLAPLKLDAALAEPGMQALQLSVRGEAGGSAKVATWKLDGALNSNLFETRGEVALDTSVPVMQAQARFDSLDLNKLLAPGRQAAAVVKPAATAPADTPLALDGLKGYAGHFNVSADSLVYRQYQVADARIEGGLQQGVLTLSRISGRAWGGRFDASARLDAGSHAMAVKLDADGVDVQALLKNVADKDILEGRGHVSADLASRGATVGALRGNLSGTAAAQLRDGAIKGFNLARSMRQAQAALLMKTDAISKASATEKTDFSELRVSARVSGGVAQSDDLDVKSPFLRLGGAGRIDVGQGRIDYIARATVASTAAGQGGAGLEALKGVTVPVLLSGPFDAIDWKVQWSGVASEALKNKAKDIVRTTLGQALDAAGAKVRPAASAAADPRQTLKESLRKLIK